MDDVLYDIRLKYIEKTFGITKHKFTISIPPNEFDDILGKNIIVFINYKDCYCIGDEPKTDILHLQKKGIITIKDMIQFLVDKKYDPGCDHCFLEGFDIYKVFITEVVAVFGS